MVEVGEDEQGEWHRIEGAVEKDPSVALVCWHQREMKPLAALYVA
jgi:hypothetical protein